MAAVVGVALLAAALLRQVAVLVVVPDTEAILVGQVILLTLLHLRVIMAAMSGLMVAVQAEVEGLP
jgi:hypothetical protein